MKSMLLKTLLAAALTAAAHAAPTVTRLNPPSALFTYGDATPPYIARFLPAQRFDLQATIQADAGQTITSVAFKVNGVTVASPAGASGESITAIGSDKFSAALRAYSNTTPGVKTLTVEVTQSDNQTATATGNFEVVSINLNGGRKAKNIIYFIGDGMGIAHRTAARIVAKGVAQGKAVAPLAMDTLSNTALVMTSSLNSIVTDSRRGPPATPPATRATTTRKACFPTTPPPALTTSGTIRAWSTWAAIWPARRARRLAS